MQDRFKFRVWNKLANVMTYNVCFGNFELKTGETMSNKIDWIGVDYNKPETFICFKDTLIKDLELMQCTGLKDKNGKLIYEGDFVKCGKFIYRVAYDNIKFASFVLIRTNELEMFKHYFGEAVDSEDVEIIGNIYETPDLLTESEEQ
ncbi:MAG: YopX family protein [Candidatus Gastranaerophilales bacterium]|nr:YopX family protein [Candidatus Gastranaerophilales bacterium]